MLVVTRGPGDSKLLCGPTTRIEGKEKFDSKGKEKARKAQVLEKAGTESASQLASNSSELVDLQA